SCRGGCQTRPYGGWRERSAAEAADGVLLLALEDDERRVADLRVGPGGSSGGGPAHRGGLDRQPAIVHKLVERAEALALAGPARVEVDDVGLAFGRHNRSGSGGVAAQDRAERGDVD